MGLGEGLLQIAMAALGIAVITLLVGNAGATSQVVQSGGGVFIDLIRTLTLQNQGGFGVGIGGRYGR